MNRKSLGADIYSPIRCNTSFNDSSLGADGSILEFSGISSGGAKGHSEAIIDFELFKHLSDEDTFERQNDKRGMFKMNKKNNSGNSSSRLKKDELPIPNFKESAALSELNDSVFSKSPSKDSLMSNKSTENTHVTKRSQSVKVKADTEKPTKEASVKKKNPKKEADDRYITKRNNSRRSSEKNRLSCRSNVDILPTHSEASEDLKHLVPETSSMSDKSKKGSFSNDSRLLEMSNSSVVDGSCQTDLTVNELQSIIETARKYNENKGGPCVHNAGKKLSDMENPVSQVAQIQANIMEKLVKDIVDPECDEIRQILYLHHLANSKLLFKILDELEEGRSKELLKENQQLRFENQQIRVENQQIRNENIQLRKIHFANQYNNC